MSSSLFVRRAVRTLVVACALLGSVGAQAASAVTVRVDDDRAQCPKAAFRRISAALKFVGPGSTVVVCPGAYVGPLRMDKPGVRLIGLSPKRSDVVVVPDPRDPSTPVVEMSAPATTLARVTMRDPVVADPLHAPCSPPLSVLVDNGAGPFTEASVIDNVVVRQRATVSGSSCTFDGVGIEVGGAAPGASPGRARVRNSALAARIFPVQVHAGSTANIKGNLIDGTNTSDNPGLNRSGIGIRSEGDVRIWQNNVSGYVFGVFLQTGTATVGAPGLGNNLHGMDIAVIVEDLVAATVANNNIHANGLGLNTFGSRGSVVTGNVMRGNGGGIALGDSENIFPFRGTDGAVVASNEIRDGGFAISAGSFSSGNRIVANVATNTTCFDFSTGNGTAGTANTWLDNIAENSSPPGLCQRFGPSAGVAAAGATGHIGN